ncbi:hypothetical protein COO60DRAFT_1499948 [Scenedesmus sp. NREL 46B-D3]|nr:hypothetical protein COO60DRAFT_1499948 [Scenedesmus sp. NREL 46B-D3]
MQRCEVRKPKPPAVLGSHPQHQHPQQFPCFGVWQARQLWGREVFFAIVLLTTLLIYFSRTVPELCAAASGPSSCRPFVAGPTQHTSPARGQMLLMVPAGNDDGNSRQCSAEGEQCSAAAETGAGVGARVLQLRGIRLALTTAAKLARPLVFLTRVSAMRNSRRCQ